MELPELGYSDDKSFFDGLMSAYPPVPGHLKTGKAGVEIEMTEDGDLDDEAEIDGELGDKANVEKDMSDDELRKNNDRLDALENVAEEDTAGVIGRKVKRRLKKKAQRPTVVIEDDEKDDGERVPSGFEAEIDALFGDDLVGRNFTDFDEGEDGGEKIAKDLGISVSTKVRIDTVEGEDGCCATNVPAVEGVRDAEVNKNIDDGV